MSAAGAAPGAAPTLSELEDAIARVGPKLTEDTRRRAADRLKVECWLQRAGSAAAAPAASGEEPAAGAAGRLARWGILQGPLAQRVLKGAGGSEAAAPDPPADGVAGRLARLAQLRHHGFLSDDEYAAAVRATAPPPADGSSALLGSLQAVAAWQRDGGDAELLAELKRALLPTAALTHGDVRDGLKALDAERERGLVSAAEYEASREALRIAAEEGRGHVSPALTPGTPTTPRDAAFSDPAVAESCHRLLAWNVLPAAAAQRLARSLPPRAAAGDAAFRADTAADRLDRLWLLHKRGLLDLDEFAAAKAAAVPPPADGSNPLLGALAAVAAWQRDGADAQLLAEVKRALLPTEPLTAEATVAGMEALWAERQRGAITEEEFSKSKEAVLTAAEAAAPQPEGPAPPAQPSVLELGKLWDRKGRCAEVEEAKAALLRQAASVPRGPGLRGNAVLIAVTELAAAWRSGELTAAEFAEAKALVLGGVPAADPLCAARAVEHLCAMHQDGRISRAEFAEAKEQMLAQVRTEVPPAGERNLAALLLSLCRSRRLGALDRGTFAQAYRELCSADPAACGVGLLCELWRLGRVAQVSHAEGDSCDPRDVEAALAAALPDPAAGSAVAACLAGLWQRRRSDAIDGDCWRDLTGHLLGDQACPRMSCASALSCIGHLSRTVGEADFEHLKRTLLRARPLQPSGIRGDLLAATLHQLWQLQQAGQISAEDFADAKQGILFPDGPPAAPPAAPKDAAPPAPPATAADTANARAKRPQAARPALTPAEAEAAAAAAARLQSRGLLWPELQRSIDANLRRAAQQQPQQQQPVQQAAPGGRRGSRRGSAHAAAIIAMWGQVRSGQLTEAEFHKRKAAVLSDRPPAAAEQGAAPAVIIELWRRRQRGEISREEFELGKHRALHG